jgi:hypothetical protein
MSITGGDGWQILCPFLDCAIPPVPFPFENKGIDRLQKVLEAMKSGQSPAKEHASLASLSVQ